MSSKSPCPIQVIPTRLRLLLSTSSYPNAVLWYVCFGSTSTLLTLNTLDQIIHVSICPPGHFHYQDEDDPDVFVLDTDMESEEDAEMLFGPAPGPSCSRRAIPQHNDDEAIVISDSKSEGHADLEDVGKATLFHCSSFL